MLQTIEGSSCIWVDGMDDLENAVRVLQDADVVAVDVEGDCLGHRGSAATVQLAIPGTCYVIDLATLGMPASLQELLQSRKPIKVCHGFSGDQINLIEQFGLDFAEAGLFDTQVAALSIDGPVRKNGVVDILESFASVPQPLISEMRAMKEKLRFVDFFQRPLPSDVARYVCLDVVFLGSAFEAMMRLLLDKGTELEQIMDKSKYRGPYARGILYQPPNEMQRQRQAEKGNTWCEDTRQWLKSHNSGYGGYRGYGGRAKVKERSMGTSIVAAPSPKHEAGGRKRCAFFKRPGGCRNGNACKYLHSDS